MNTKYVVTKSDGDSVVLESKAQVVRCLVGGLICNMIDEYEVDVVGCDIKDEALIVQYDDETGNGDLSKGDTFCLAFPLVIGAVLFDIGDDIIQ